MSLKVTDWKAVLDQPKNVGLKAFGGTGISEALRKAETAEVEFHQHANEENGRKLDQALTQVRNLCDGVIKKHKTTFTTACNHLEKVKQSATTRQNSLTHEMNEIRERVRKEQERNRDRNNLRELCESTLKAVRDAKNMNELNQTWEKFQTGLTMYGKPFPGMSTVIQKAKAFKKQPDPNVGILDVRRDYVDMVNEVTSAMH
jgi:predicted RNase H-like nuclease (RuvC/YqgF family)